MASSTATCLSIEPTDDVDETPFDDEDFDLDDEGDDDADEDYDDYDDEDSSDEEENQGDDSETQAVQENDGLTPELRDYYPDVSLEENGDGSKRSPFNNPVSLKEVRLAPGATPFVRSRTVVENFEIADHGTLEEPITLAPYSHGPVSRFVIGGSAPMVARDYFVQNDYIFRGWVVKGVKMQPSIIALTGELERVRREEAEKATSKKSGKRGKPQDKDGPFTVSGPDEGDGPAQRVVTVSATADPVKDYLRQIGKVALLNAEQEVESAKRIEAGFYTGHRLAEEGNDLPAKLRCELHWVAQDGQRAKNHLLEANLQLVVFLAKRHTGRGMLFLDLIQEGNLGLIRAVEKLDYTKGFKFSTYATWRVRQAIIRAMADQVHTIRILVHMVGVTNKLAYVQRQMLQDSGREFTPEELVVELDMILEKIVEVQKYDYEPIFLHTPLGKGGDSEFDDLIEDFETVVLAGAVSFTLLQGQLHVVLDALSEREAGVVSMRFGLTDGQPKTLDEIGKVYGVIRERARQIEFKTMSRLCHPPRSQVLRDYLD